MGRLYAPPTQNFIQKTLDAALLTGATASATFNNLTGIQNLPGVFIVDRVDANGTETPNKREVIAYTATSGLTTTSLTRGLAGSTDQEHAVGAIVEFAPDVTWAQSIYDALSETVVPSTGLLDTTKVVTPSGTQTLTNKTISGASNTLTVREEDLSISDNTTRDVSTTAHGFVPKAPNDTTKFLRGDGTWATTSSTAATDGWTDDTARTWTYASATAFSVSGDVTAIFTKGTRIKLTQTTVKYFVVVSSVFSTGNTIVNVTGGTDFSVANATISSNYYSYQVNPQGYPTWFSYTPTLTWSNNSGSNPSGTPANISNKFSVIGSACTVSNFQDGFAAGTNVIRIQITMPISPSGLSSNTGVISNSDTPNNTTGFIADGGVANLFCSSVAATRFSHFSVYKF